MALCRKVPCMVIFILDCFCGTVKLCELVAAVVVVTLCPALCSPAEPVACHVIAVAGQFSVQFLPGQPAHAVIGIGGHRRME